MHRYFYNTCSQFSVWLNFKTLQFRTIHNEHPYVAIASKTPLYYFETALGIKNDDKNKKGMELLDHNSSKLYSSEFWRISFRLYVQLDDE